MLGGKTLPARPYGKLVIPEALSVGTGGSNLYQLLGVEGAVPVATSRYRLREYNSSRVCSLQTNKLVMGKAAKFPVRRTWNKPRRLTRRVISLIKTGAKRFERSFL